MISYARNFEDVMLVRALRHIERGFYVDVGASHPVADSNTQALYSMGWRGVVVEPQTVFNPLWQQHRPEDSLVNAALADQVGETTLFKPTEYGQGATINTHFAQRYVQRGLALTESTVPVHTLTDVLLATRPEGDIHLLAVDVEGAEEAVIRGLNWARFRPWLVMLESVLPGESTPHYEGWEPLLLERGYQFVYFDAVNRFYVAQEHPELQTHFNHPPCVWDEFVGHELHFLRQQKDKLTIAADWMLASAMRFKDAGDIAGFESLLWRIFDLLPTYEDVYWPLGAWLTGQGRRAEALVFYQQTVQHAPHNFYSHHNVGMLMRWEKRFEESETAFKRMMAINPSFSEGRMNYGALLLALGRYQEGWALFESRYAVAEGETPRMSHNAPFPRWTGESLEGKSMLVLREQGYGDEIMFARFVPLLKARGASRVSILCQSAVKTLLQSIPSVDDVICLEDMNDVWPLYDYWCYGQSLPHALDITLANLPAPIPYIAANVTARAAWRARIQKELPAKALKVGLTWRGNPTHGNDHNRSLASLAVLRPLWDVPNVSFVSLQTGEAAAEALVPPHDQPLAAWGSTFVDFADGAALVSELDLVISVDTAIVHVAGALGVPCWVMIPRIETDWRWLNDRHDSPWYPKGMRLFRQTQDAEWGDVFVQLKNALETLSSEVLC